MLVANCGNLWIFFLRIFYSLFRKPKSKEKSLPEFELKQNDTCI